MQNVKNEYKKIRLDLDEILLFTILLIKNNMGTKAIKIKYVKFPIFGQENAKSNPLNIEYKIFFITITNIIIFLLK